MSASFKGKHTKYHLFHGGGGVYDPEEVYQEIGKKDEKTNYETVKNRRAQCYRDIRDRIHKTWQVVNKKAFYDPDELISFSSDINCLQKLRSEICRLPRKPNGAGLFQLYSKQEMQARFKLDSPNLSDIVMMSFDKIEVDAKKKVKRKPLKLKNRGIV